MLAPSTTTRGHCRSRKTSFTVPMRPLSRPAVICTLSPFTIFHVLDSNMGLKALLYLPILSAAVQEGGDSYAYGRLGCI